MKKHILKSGIKGHQTRIDYGKNGLLSNSIRYTTKRGEISLLTPCYATFEAFEIYSIKGKLFEGIQRYSTLREAQHTINHFLIKDYNRPMRQPRTKIDIQVRKELNKYGLIIDHKGHIWKPPFQSKNGKLYPLKELIPFSHNKQYLAVQLNNKIISIKKLFSDVKEVSYKKRFEIQINKVPADLKTAVISKEKSE